MCVWGSSDSSLGKRGDKTSRRQDQQRRRPLPLTVLLATGRAARGSRPVSVSFGVAVAFPPTAGRHSLGGAGPLDGTTVRCKGQ